MDQLIDSTGIFARIDQHQQKIEVTRLAAPVSEFFKEIMPGVFECLITDRKLNSTAFRRLLDQSCCGPMEFVVENNLNYIQIIVSDGYSFAQ